MIFEIKCSFSLIKQFILYFILYKTFPNCEKFLELSDESDVDRFYHVSTGKTTGKKRRWGSTFAFTMKVKKSGKKNLTPHPPQKVGSSYPNHTYQPRPKQCATQCMIIGFKYLRLLSIGNVTLQNCSTSIEYDPDTRRKLQKSINTSNSAYKIHITKEYNFIQVVFIINYTEVSRTPKMVRQHQFLIQDKYFIVTSTVSMHLMIKTLLI